MKLKLFDQDELYIGNIKDVISAHHPDELNGENFLEFETLDLVHKNQRVLYKNIYNKWQEMIIKGIDTTRGDDGVVSMVYAEHSVYETLGDYLEAGGGEGWTAKRSLDTVLAPTRWKAGIVDSFEVQDIEFYQLSCREAIQQVAETYEGELHYRIEVLGNKIVGRYVDLLTKRGHDLGKRFTYTKDLTNIKKIVQRDEVVTALYGYGKGLEMEEGVAKLTGEKAKRLTFADINDGKAYAEDKSARKLWGREENGTKVHVFDQVYFDDVEDPKELLIKTIEKLKEVNEPRITYEADVIDLKAYGFEHEGVTTGDTVTVIDKEFTPELRLKARVISMDSDLLYPEETSIVLGNFIPGMSDAWNKLNAYVHNFRAKEGIWDRADNFEPDGSIDTDWWNDMVEGLTEAMNALGGYVYISDEGDGIVIYDRPADQNPQMAMQLKGGMFGIAAGKLPNGEFNWRTFGDGNGLYADAFIGGILKGGQVEFDLTMGTLLIGHSIADHTLYFDGHTLSIKVRGKELEQTIDDAIQESKDYSDEELGNFEGYIEDAFKDGVISEAEAIAISKYINLLNAEKEVIDKDYEEIINNILLVGTPRANLERSYKHNTGIQQSGVHYDYLHLIGTIESAISDGLTTPQESKQVDMAFDRFRYGLKEFNNMINLAIDSINAIISDQIEGAYDHDRNGINALRDELKGAFADGIIDDSELEAIKTHIKTLELDKIRTENDYKKIKGNTKLMYIDKQILENAYTNYSNKHQTLINTIYDVIADGEITSVESKRVNDAFDAYFVELDRFILAMNAAVKKIDEAWNLEIDDKVDTVKKEASGIVSDLRDYVDKEFKVGVFDDTYKDTVSTVQRTLQSDMSKLNQEYREVYFDNEWMDLTPAVRRKLRTDYDIINDRYQAVLAKIIWIISKDNVGKSGRADLLRLMDLYTDYLPTYYNSLNAAINYLGLSFEDRLDVIKKTADDSYDLVEGFASDTVWTPAEKRVIKKELDKIDDEYPALREQSWDAWSSYTPVRQLDSAYTALKDHMNVMLPPMNGNTTVFTQGKANSYLRAYYDEKILFLTALNKKSQTKISNVDASASRAESQANSAVTKANDASTAAGTAQSNINNIFADGIVTPDEKIILKREWDMLVDEYPQIVKQADQYASETYVTGRAFVRDYDSLRNAVTPILRSMTASSSVTRSTFNKFWSEYTYSKEALLARITWAAKQELSNRTSRNGLLAAINLDGTTAKIQGSNIELTGVVTVLSELSDNADLGVINAGRLYGPRMDIDLKAPRFRLHTHDRGSVYDQVIIDGTSNMFKIHMQVDTSIILSTSKIEANPVYISHGLGYVPAFAAFQVDSPGTEGGNIALPAFSITRPDSSQGDLRGTIGIGSVLRASATENHIVIEWIQSNNRRLANPGIRTALVRVFIYKEALI